MNRRGFLRGLVGGVATTAAVRTFPFRVFSFPTEVIKPSSYATYVMGRDADLIGATRVLTVADIRRIVAQLKNCRPLWPEKVVYTINPRVEEYFRQGLPPWTKSMTPGLPGTGQLTAR